jgi:hypothetical protein
MRGYRRPGDGTRKSDSSFTPSKTGSKRHSDPCHQRPDSPLMRLDTLQSLVSCQSSKLIRLLAPYHEHAVSSSSIVFPWHRPRNPCLSLGSSSLELLLLFRDNRLSLSWPKSQACLPEFSSSSRHQPAESTNRRASNARLCSALSVSHTHDDLLLRQTLQAYFIL